MTVIEITPEENNDPPIEEIVEELTDTIETVTEELTDTIEELAETIEDIVEENNDPQCCPHCEAMSNKIAELEERINVTQEHIVDEQIAEIVTPEPEPDPTPPEPESEPVPETTETEVNPLETMIEPPTNRTEKSGPNGFLKVLKAIGF